METTNISVTIGILCIKFYKYTISPYIPRSCRHQPTCSSYAIQALEKYGFLKGIMLILNRLMRCTPFGTKGFDPIP